MEDIPGGAYEFVEHVFPDAVSFDYAVHSDRCCTVCLLTDEGRQYIFRLTLGVDNRWSLVPLHGFRYSLEPELEFGDYTWGMPSESN